MTSRFLASRRKVLQQLGMALGSAVVGVAAHAVPRGARGFADPELATAVERLITHRHSAAIIGEYYLTKFENEMSAEVLAAAIRQGLPAGAGHIDEYTLLARIQADFARGEIVNLHGWLLSRTEARLCALYAV